MNSKDIDFLRSVIDQRMRTTSTNPQIPNYRNYRGSDQKIPSLGTGIGNAVLKETKQYTGSKMIGISQMAKSNAIPIFNSDHIEEVARMRR